jgi:hypothetical protein
MQRSSTEKVYRLTISVSVTPVLGGKSRAQVRSSFLHMQSGEQFDAVLVR